MIKRLIFECRFGAERIRGGIHEHGNMKMREKIGE
jgi:hypothetical protein